MTKKKPLITLLGPTASGKTSLAVALAKRINAEIISADSRQVYREMDIGTGKDLSEYQSIPYHLIDIIEAGEKYNLALFQEDFQEALNNISSKGKQAILCGGSGLYIQAVLQDFNFTTIPTNENLRLALDHYSLEDLRKRFEELKKTIPYPSNPTSKRQLTRAIETIHWQEESKKEVDIPVLIQQEKDEAKLNLAENPFEQNARFIFGLNPKPEIRRERISNRLKERLNQGLLEEVSQLLDRGITPEELIYYGLEYKWATLYLRKEVSYSEFYNLLEIAIHQFSKRQMTYFRKMEKDGLKIQWLDPTINQVEQVTFMLQYIESNQH